MSKICRNRVVKHKTPCMVIIHDSIWKIDAENKQVKTSQCSSLQVSESVEPLIAFFSFLAFLLRIPCRTFSRTIFVVLMMTQKFVEAAKWHYAKTAIEHACCPQYVSFQWELQTTISGAILATCCIPFKFDGLKLLFACLLGQRSQRASCFSFIGLDGMEASTCSSVKYGDDTEMWI